MNEFPSFSLNYERSSSELTKGRCAMLRWAAIFFVISIIAAVFGFTGIAVAAAGIAKFLFFIFLVACLIFFIMGMTAGRRTP